MHTGRAILDTLAGDGVDFATGVPCSTLGGVFAALDHGAGPAYVPASGEGEAVAIAAGAELAGRRPLVCFQNSGLGNAVNPLAALTQPFAIPLTLLMSWRGQPGLGDAPQHAVMGTATQPILAALGIAHQELADTGEGATRQLDRARAVRATGNSTAFIVPHGRLADGPAEAPATTPAESNAPSHTDVRRGGPLAPRHAALRALADAVPADTAVIATTGKCAREFHTIADRPGAFYVTGGMGCAAGIGLGVALAQPRRRVVVLDGDGALTMRPGSLATIGGQAPANLTHVVLDNAAHESTGGQATANPRVDFPAAARACGYAATAACDDPADLAALAAGDAAGTGPSLVHMRIATGALANLGRPDRPLPELAERFRGFLRGA